MSAQAPPTLGQGDAVIDGRRVAAAGAATFEDLDPATGEVIAHVARCGAGEVDEAIAAARATFTHDWRLRTPAERSDILQQVASAIRAHADELSVMESTDTGKPLTQARADVAVTARYFDYYARTSEALFGTTTPLGTGHLAYTLREPYGVTGHIVPWNYPAQMVGRTVAPTLAAGNCCVLKPAEEAPLSSLRIAELALEAGLPAGAFNVVPGLGEEAGAALAASGGLDFLSFTGSNEVGRIVSHAAAEHVIPTTLELGGKSPHIVFDDADLERAVPTIVRSIIQNAGQTCSAGSRVIVARGVHAQVRDEIARRFAALRIGRGVDDPDLGPLISERQRERVLGYIAGTGADGTLVCGGAGAAPDGLRGFFVEATLFDDVDPRATIAQEEVFGPVLTMMAFDNLDEALELADCTPYGLVAGIWTRDVARAHRVASALRVGQAFINGYGAGGGVELAFGGVKQSGHGREKGFDGLLACTRTKTVVVTLE